MITLTKLTELSEITEQDLKTLKDMFSQRLKKTVVFGVSIIMSVWFVVFSCAFVSEYSLLSSQSQSQSALQTASQSSLQKLHRSQEQMSHMQSLILSDAYADDREPFNKI